jgi:hypothetical protein
MADTTLHGHTRAVKMLLRFWGTLKAIYCRGVYFDMPKIAEKKLPVLDTDELKRVIDTCRATRDEALVMFWPIPA